MLAFGNYSSALGPTLIVMGLGMLLLPMLNRNSTLVRCILFGTAIVLAWRYMIWRFVETIPREMPDIAIGFAFAILEAATILSSTLALSMLSRTRDRSDEADRQMGWWKPASPPMVDVLVATYNEEEAILERTLVGAMALSHPQTRVWVLDDGKRAGVEALCARLGVRYLTRSNNNHAKAGNINAAFSVLRELPEPPDFIAVLDADFVPHRDFLDRTLALFKDPTVGLVQTPQHFFNDDPIQHNLGLGDAYPDEQRFFFDHLQPARDAWGIAFCCGTSSVMRWSALEAIGGFPVGSVTEDYLITLRLREEGLSTVYLAEPLTEGLAPEGLGEYVTQRGRWCLGLMQIIRGPMGPFARNRLRIRDRIGLVDSLLFWATTYPFRLACLLAPLLYWYLGITLVNAPPDQVVYYFLPYIITVLMALNWISRGLVVPVLNDVSQILGAKEITKAAAIGLFGSKDQKFKVTIKGGDRSRTVVQWSLIKPLLFIFILTVGGMLFSPLTGVQFDRDAGDGKWVILFWSFYNLIVLAVTMLVCVELPRGSESHRLPPERVVTEAAGVIQHGWLMRLTANDARIRGGTKLRRGATCTLRLTGVGEVTARVIRVDAGGFDLRWTPDAELRAALLEKLHTRRGAKGTTRTDMGGIIKGLVRRIFRQGNRSLLG